MEVKQGVLVLADISGYTHFTRMHATSLLHAEEIISELLEAVIEAAEFPLQVSQLEGDAVLLVADVSEGREAEAARDVARQVGQLFAAFNTRERALIACDAGCVCDACNQIGQLKLKAVLHFGEYTPRRIGEVETLSGADVRLVRAMIKAAVPAAEFILLTRRFYELSGGLDGRPASREMEVAGPGQEDVAALVYLPEAAQGAQSLPHGAGPAFSGRLNRHAFARMFGLRQRAAFNHLAGGPMNLVVYLAEGLSSGVNVLRKGLRSMRPQGNRPMEIRPVALVLLEISGRAAAGGMAGESAAADLLRSVLDGAYLPLTLNKLEGEAAFLYAVASNGERTAARNVAWQVQEFFTSFKHAAQPAEGLHFRVLLHFGKAAFKKVEQFEEIAGEDVILIHRLLKNDAAAQDFALMTGPFYRLSGGLPGVNPEQRSERAEGFGELPVWVFPLDRE